MNYYETISLSGKGFCDLINITSEVEKVVKNSKIKEGVVIIFVAHSTMGVTTIEDEPNLIKDFKELIEKLVPEDKGYYHDRAWDEGNGFSHLRASLIGPSLVIPLIHSELKLGPWQQIVAIDFDNRPREREVIVKIIGE